MKTSWNPGITACLRALAVIAMSMSMGCASLPAARDAPDVQETLGARGLPAVSLEPPADLATAQAPLDREGVLALAFRQSPRILESYAKLGLSRAELIDASRLPNPGISYQKLEQRGGDASQVTRGVSVPFGEYLLWPVRARLASATFAGERERIAAALVALGAEVEAAWLDYVTAQQVASMRNMAAEAMAASGALATTLHEAGNLARRDLALALAEAESARIAAARARAESLRSRATLAALLGLRTRDEWTTVPQLPAPVVVSADAAALEEQALRERLDLSAARRQAVAAESAYRFTRRWRWLGLVQVGYERESETGGPPLRGFDVAWEIPIFNWNGGTVLRQRIAATRARADLAAREMAVRNDVALALDRLQVAASIAESYRSALLPQREAVVERTLEQYNFMLTDAFELLDARRETYDAYEEYLEAVRDYWQARNELRLAVGGLLPEDALSPTTPAAEPTPAPPTGVHPHSHHEDHQP